MSEFTSFWELFPRREGRLKAEEKFEAARTLASFDEIMNGLERSIDYWIEEQMERQYIPMPATWLHQGRWGDDYSFELKSERETEFDFAENTQANLRTHDQWRALFGKPSDFTRQRLLNDWNYHRDGASPGEQSSVVPAEILREYGFIMEVAE